MADEEKAGKDKAWLVELLRRKERDTPLVELLRREGVGSEEEFFTRMFFADSDMFESMTGPDWPDVGGGEGMG